MMNSAIFAAGPALRPLRVRWCLLMRMFIHKEYMLSWSFAKMLETSFHSAALSEAFRQLYVLPRSKGRSASYAFKR